jgi:hypothetical protein
MTLLVLLSSVCKRACGAMDADGVPNLSSAKKSEREAVEASRTAFSAVFIGVVNQLLSLYQLEETKVVLVLQMLRRISLDQYSVLRKKKDTAAHVLEEAAATLSFLATEDHPFRDEAQSTVDELAAKLADSFNSIYNRIHGSQMSVDEDADDSLQSLLHTLRRMMPLARSLHPPSLAWDALPNLERTLLFYAMNHTAETEQEVLRVLLQYAFANLQHGMVQIRGTAAEALEDEGEEKEDEEEKGEEEEEQKQGSKKKKKAAKKRGGRKSGAAAAASAARSLVNSTHRLQKVFVAQLDVIFTFTGAAAPLLKDDVFRVLSDTFILFGGKLAGISGLEDLAIKPDMLTVLQGDFNKHFEAIMSSPRSKDSHIMDKKIEACLLASKVQASCEATPTSFQCLSCGRAHCHTCAWFMLLFLSCRWCATI